MRVGVSEMTAPAMEYVLEADLPRGPAGVTLEQVINGTLKTRLAEWDCSDCGKGMVKGKDKG